MVFRIMTSECVLGFTDWKTCFTSISVTGGEMISLHVLFHCIEIISWSSAQSTGVTYLFTFATVLSGNGFQIYKTNSRIKQKYKLSTYIKHMQI